MRNQRRSLRGGRAPLFGALRRTLGLAGLAEAGGRPAGEAAGRPAGEAAGRGLTSRREWLAGSAALLALGAGPRPARADPPPPGTASPRIAVVGAGMAGLRAAYELEGAGLPVRVFEAASRIGGRILSAKDRLGPGLVVELGGEFIDSQHREMIRLARAFDLELLDLAADRPGGLAREAYFFEGAHRTEAEAIEAVRPLVGRMRRDARSLGEPRGYPNNPAACRLDRLSIAEYLDELGAGGWIRKLIDVAFAAEYGLDADRLSAINLLSQIGTDADAGEFILYGESDERYKVRGGNAQVVEALARRLEGRIAFEHRLESVRPGASGEGFRLHFAGPGGRPVVAEADFVVLAVPFSVLRRVELGVELPPRKRRAIDELGYGTNAKLALGFARRVWRDRGYTGATFTDEPLQSAWDGTRLQPGDPGALVLFAGGREGVAFGEGTAAERAGRLLPGVERVFPGSSASANGRVERYHWPTAPLALGSYACYTPGQWTGLAGAEGTPVGNLYFAGEHCHFGDSGYMESAAASGRRTARALLASLADR